jgi:hypothetical protein
MTNKDARFNNFGKVALSIALFLRWKSTTMTKKIPLFLLSRRRLSQSVVALVWAPCVFALWFLSVFAVLCEDQQRGVVVIARRLAGRRENNEKRSWAALNPSSPHHPQKIAMAAVRARGECVRNNKVIHKMRGGPHCSCACKQYRRNSRAAYCSLPPRVHGNFSNFRSTENIITPTWGFDTPLKRLGASALDCILQRTRIFTLFHSCVLKWRICFIERLHYFTGAEMRTFRAVQKWLLLGFSFAWEYILTLE